MTQRLHFHRVASGRTSLEPVLNWVLRARKTKPSFKVSKVAIDRSMYGTESSTTKISICPFYLCETIEKVENMRPTKKYKRRTSRPGNWEPSHTEPAWDSIRISSPKEAARETDMRCGRDDALLWYYPGEAAHGRHKDTFANLMTVAAKNSSSFHKSEIAMWPLKGRWHKDVEANSRHNVLIDQHNCLITIVANCDFL